MSDLKNFSGEVVFLEGGVSCSPGRAECGFTMDDGNISRSSQRCLQGAVITGVWWHLAIGLLVYCVSYLSGSERVCEFSSHIHGIYKTDVRPMALRQC